MFDRDKDIINKLEENVKGNYPRFTSGDVEYIIFSLQKLNELERKIEKKGMLSLFNKI